MFNSYFWSWLITYFLLFINTRLVTLFTKNIGIRIVQQVLQFIIILLIARLTGPSGNGIFSLFLTDVTLFILFFGLSCESAILYFSVKNKLEASHIISLLFPLLLFEIAGCIILFFLFSFFLHYTFFQTGEKNYSLSWGIIFIVSSTILSFCNAFLNAKKIFFKLIFANVTVQIILLAILAVLYSGIAGNYNFFFTTRFLIPAYSLIYVCHAIISLYFVLKFNNNKKLVLKKPFAIFTRPFKIYILFVSTANILQFFAYKMDIWFLDYYHTKYEIGIYSIAVKVVQLIWVLPQLFAALLFPLTALKHESASSANFKKIIKIFSFITIAGILLAVFIYPFAIKIFVGNAFSESYVYFLFLLPGVVLFSINIILAARLAGHGNVQINLEAAIICFVIMLLLDYLLIPSMKGKGAAIATSIGYSISTVYIVVRYFQWIKITRKD